MHTLRLGELASQAGQGVNIIAPNSAIHLPASAKFAKLKKYLGNDVGSKTAINTSSQQEDSKTNRLYKQASHILPMQHQDNTASKNQKRFKSCMKQRNDGTELTHHEISPIKTIEKRQ